MSKAIMTDSAIMTVANAEKITGITVKEVSRWRKRLGNKAKYREHMIVAAYRGEREACRGLPSQCLGEKKDYVDLAAGRPIPILSDGSGSDAGYLRIERPPPAASVFQ